MTLSFCPCQKSEDDNVMCGLGLALAAPRQILASGQAPTATESISESFAGEQGFEPRPATPEAAVLPLDDSPKAT